MYEYDVHRTSTMYLYDYVVDYDVALLEKTMMEKKGKRTERESAEAKKERCEP